MIRRIARGACLVAVVLLAEMEPALAGKAKRASVDPASLPGWLRDAAARKAPATGARLAVLHVEEIMEPLAGGASRETSRTVRKILTTEGLDDAAGCGASYRSSFDTIEKLASWTILPDGSAWVPDLTRDVRDDPAFRDYPMAQDERARTLGTTHAVVGAVVACETVVLRGLDTGSEVFSFGEADVPTVIARFELKTPEGWSSEAVTERAEGLVVERSPRGFVATGRDLAPLRHEPLRPVPSALLPRIWARWSSPDGRRGFNDWDAVARWTDDLTSGVMAERGSVAVDALRWKPPDQAHFLDSLDHAFDYAARDVRYVAIALGIGGWKPHTPAFVAANKFGDCKDKSFLLRAILDTWGVSSYPVLVRTHAKGPVEPRVPTFAQFDHMILAVPLPPGVGEDLWTAEDVPGLGRLLFVDGTDYVGSTRSMRDDVQGTTALVVRGGSGTLVRLPSAPPSASRVDHDMSATVDEHGALTQGRVAERWGGLAGKRVRMALQAQSIEERRRQWQERLQATLPGTEMAGVTFDGIDRIADDVTAEASLGAGHLGKRVGDLLVVEPGRIGGGLVRETLAPPPRQYALDLDHPREDHVVARIALARGWAPEALPPPMTVSVESISGRATWAFRDGALTYERTATLLVGDVPPEAYASFRDALVRLQSADAMAVVFVRTP
jgi:hypothetical protein